MFSRWTLWIIQKKGGNRYQRAQLIALYNFIYKNSQNQIFKTHKTKKIINQQLSNLQKDLTKIILKIIISFNAKNPKNKFSNLNSLKNEFCISNKLICYIIEKFIFQIPYNNYQKHINLAQMGNEINQNVIDADNQAHERLGVIKIYEDSKLSQNNETTYRIQINKEIQSQKKYQKWTSDLKTIDSQQSRQVLYLPDNFKFQQTGFCGSSGILKLSFQYFPFILKTEVKNRRKMSQYFQQTELWYLLYNLVQAASIFQKRNKKLGDVHPKSVLLNDNGQVKIICQHSLPDQITNYDKIIQSITSDVYLAPEQIDQLFIQKGAYPNVDKCRAQVFSIGMTLLEAATLQDCYYVYNRGPLKVNKKKLVQLYKIIGQKYSHDFCETLTNMLNQNPKSRRKSSQIYNILYPHEYQILQLSPFKFQQTAYNPNIPGSKQFQSQPSIARNIQNSKGYGYNY